jgi:hypothetical protein
MSILVILLVILSFALTIYATGPLFFSIICCTIIAVSVVMPLAQKTIPRESAPEHKSMNLADDLWTGRHSVTETGQYRNRLQLRNICDTEQDPYDSTSSDELDHASKRTDKSGYALDHR